MTRRFRAILALVSLTTLAVATNARADGPHEGTTDNATKDGATNDAATIAAQFFRAGRAAYDRKEYRAAALAFLEAYRRVPRAAAIYDAGRSWLAAGENELAADAFARALDGTDLDAADVDDARNELAKLTASLAIVDVRAPAGALITVRGVERGPVPLAVHLAPGTHEVHVHRRDGSDVSREVTLTQAGERIEIEFDDIAPPTEPPPPLPLPTPPPAPPPPPRATPVAAWITIGVASAAAIGGIYTYSRFSDARSQFESSGSRDASAHDDAQRWRTWTYALWGGAAALGIVGGVLFATSGPSRTRGTTASLGVAPGGLTLTIVR